MGAGAVNADTPIDPPLGFAFDTNALFQYRVLEDVCKLALAAGSYRLMVPVICHGERLRQLMVQHGSRYGPHQVAAYIEQNGLEVVDLSADHAEAFAELASSRYPSEGEWRAATTAACDWHAPEPEAEEPASPPHAPTTADWFVAAAAAAEGLVLVSDDQGEELSICTRWTLSKTLGYLRGRASTT